MTPKQRQLYDWICAFVAAHGYSPSYVEMMGAMGLRSRAGIHRLVHGLLKRGYITHIPGHARSIQVREEAAPPMLPASLVS